MTLHYLVGVTFAHLQRKDDAIIAFRWVVEHGRPGSKGVQGASQWLAEYGMLPTTTAAAASTDEEESVVGVMEGRTDWPDLDPDRILPRLQMQLEGVGTTTQGKRYGIQTALNGTYKFPQGAAGRRLPPARPDQLHPGVGHAGGGGREDGAGPQPGQRGRREGRVPQAEALIAGPDARPVV